MIRVTIFILMLVVLLAGGVWLQFLLSGKEGRWYGLMLPFITLAYSLIMVFSLVAYSGWHGDWKLWSQVFSILLAGNIPTVVLLTIYFSCREKRKKKKQMEKMLVDDL